MTLFKRLRACAGAVALGAAFLPASAQNLLDVAVTEPGGAVVSKSIVLALDKSIVVETGRPAGDVVITNPLIADAAVQTAERMIFRGVQVGQTNAFIFDREGNQILNLEIRVEPDTAALSELIAKYVPDARVSVEAVNSNIVLSGAIDSLSQSDQIVRLTTAYLGLGEDSENGIINMMSIGAKDQVLLKVRIVEMQRSLIKQLGINLDNTTNFGQLEGERISEIVGGPNDGDRVLEGAPPFENSFGFSTANAFNVAGGALGGLGAAGTITNLLQGQDEQSQLGVSLRALERVGLVRTLAEPNITALSGEPANFLAGGEFPVPVGQTQDNTVTIEFKPFGVGLGFTPIVLSEGRISLRMSTEVSELSALGAFQGGATTFVGPDGELQTAQTLTIPALTVRRAETTVELPSGGSMMIAGLIESSTRQTIDQIPGLRNLPVLGALFRSRDFINEETELVIIVTPYLVEPGSPSDFRSPDKGFANASDAKTIFFGKLNRMYGRGEGDVNPDGYAAPVGFIEE